MNYRKIGNILGKILIIEGALMLAPLAVALIYKELSSHITAYVIPILCLWVVGFLLQLPRPKRNALYQREGFALTALVWALMTVFGAIPFVLSGEIPNYVDACFEMMSGFTTTGASIITDIGAVAHSTLFWRSFSHWIGGMGILVFVLIFIPESNDGSSMHLLRAESPGPQVGKLVSKMKVTARILYLIYLAMTVLEVFVLMLDKPIAGYENDKLFLSLLASFGCAGAGGFGFLPGSAELFHPFSQYVMAVFLILFGCNFSIYYLLLIRKFKEVFRSEELKAYIAIVVSAVALIFVNLMQSGSQGYGKEEAFRHAFFQTASIITTAGYTTTDYNVWPQAASTVLILLMFVGAMAGSTAGGLKVSRIVIAFKGIFYNIRKLIDPHYVPSKKMEGKVLDSKTVNDVFAYITLYFLIFMAVLFLLAFDPVNGKSFTVVSDAGTYQVEHGFFSNFSATLAAMSNIGPGFEAVGPYLSYAAYSDFSKVLLTLAMMIGRLEILPVLILFNRKTWKNY